jgi:hypothetical protein
MYCEFTPDQANKQIESTDKHSGRTKSIPFKYTTDISFIISKQVWATVYF